MATRATGFASSQKGEQARMMGMAMAAAIQKERRRYRWHFVGIWAAIALVFFMAALG